MFCLPFDPRWLRNKPASSEPRASHVNHRRHPLLRWRAERSASFLLSVTLGLFTLAQTLRSFSSADLVSRVSFLALNKASETFSVTTSIGAHHDTRKRHEHRAEHRTRSRDGGAWSRAACSPWEASRRGNAAHVYRSSSHTEVRRAHAHFNSPWCMCNVVCEGCAPRTSARSRGLKRTPFRAAKRTRCGPMHPLRQIHFVLYHSSAAAINNNKHNNIINNEQIAKRLNAQVFGCSSRCGTPRDHSAARLGVEGWRAISSLSSVRVLCATGRASAARPVRGDQVAR